MSASAALLVATMPRPLGGRRRALAEVVDQCREADLGVAAQQRRLIQHHERVHAGVDLRVPLRRLRYAEQRVDLRDRCARARRSRAAPGRTRWPRSSRSAFSVSCHTRSATSASTSWRRTMPRIKASVSGAIVKPSGAKRAAKRASAQHAHRILD